MKHGTSRRHDEHGGHHSHGRGREGHGGRRGGLGGRHHDRMERGALRFVLLDALSAGPRHGYEMMKTLEERTHGQYAPSPGAVYPTLQYLDDLGHVLAKQEGDRRVYELTESGRVELAAQKERVDAFWGRFGSDAASESVQHEVGFLKDELEDLAGTVWGGLRDAIGRDDQETVRRVRQAVERCQEEVRRLIAGGPAAAGIAGQPA